MSDHRIGGNITPNALIPTGNNHLNNSSNYFIVQSPLSNMAGNNSAQLGSYFQKPPTNRLVSNEYVHNTGHQTYDPSGPSHHYSSHPQPPSHPLSSPQMVGTFDPGFQVPSTEGLGLIPMPVPYEDFKFSLPTLSALQPHLPQPVGNSSTSASTAIQNYTTSTTGCHNQPYHSLTYPQNSYHHRQSNQPQQSQHLHNLSSSYSNDWSLPSISPLSRTSLVSSQPSPPAPQPSQMATLSDLLNSTSHQQTPSRMPISYQHYQQQQDQNSGSFLISPDVSSNPRMFGQSSVNSPPSLPLPKPSGSSRPPTPPPLFDASEKDLLSSFLNIFGDSNGEWDFDPQGMPEGMPVLGALKRRLEATPNHATDHWYGKYEADEMGRQVESRLKLDDLEPCPDRLCNLSSLPPALQRTPTQAECASLPISPRRSEDEQTGRKKKIKTDSRTYPLPISLSDHSMGKDVDVEMAHFKSDLITDPTVFQSVLGSGRLVSNLQPPLSSSSTSMLFDSHNILPLLSDNLSKISEQVPQNNGVEASCYIKEAGGSSTSKSLSVGAQSWNALQPPLPLVSSIEDGKKTKSTHIASEQRRRSAIQGGFGNLVGILKAGEAISGISIASTDAPESTAGGSNCNPKPTTRGRGRRGEIETGASKSVVLERAAEYVKWMYTGNVALKLEVERVENLLKANGVDI
ncbi:expressed protein [Phakopsora pachyrhizi]|uniref:Expressed protein n=1 Tax=Phakopsora pachyrhizi TaxID=170000 RepID=A0AAV0B3G3_PHAPC|nr:expressed protein [Phakopsora pachyrhizi]